MCWVSSYHFLHAVWSYSFPHLYSHAHTYIQMHIPMCTHAHMHTRTHTYTHTHTHTHIHTHTHTHTHTDVNPPAQYHSLSSTHYTNPPKLGAIRQESTQSDSVMLMPFSNPSLALHQNKSGSDLNIPGRESQKNSGTYVGMAGHGNLLNSTNELGWLDLDNSSLLNLSPTLNTFGGLSHHSSNPGSLPHEQFHLSFMEDGVHTKCSNISTNGLSSHGVHEASSYMDHGISQQAGLFPPTDDAALIVELGLSTS